MSWILTGVAYLQVQSELPSSGRPHTIFLLWQKSHAMSLGGHLKGDMVSFLVFGEIDGEWEWFCCVPLGAHLLFTWEIGGRGASLMSSI